MAKFKFILILSLIIFLIGISSVLAVPMINYNFDNSKLNKSYYSYPDTIKSDNLVLQIVSINSNDICKYSKTSGVDYNSMEYLFDYNFQNIHKVDFTNLDNGIYKYYIKCIDSFGNISGELEVSFGVSVPITARISLSGNNSYVDAGIVKVNLVTSDILSVKPTLAYSLNGINYDPIPLTGSDTNWFGYIVIPNDAGEAAGSFRFRGVDMDGAVGEEITSGEIFLVDTIKPKSIVDIRVFGESNTIKIEWHFDEAVSEYRIYRNVLPNIDYSDYYDDTDDEYYVDKDIEKGKTYYYRISAVDKAGNEGPLSFEFSANSLKSNSSSSTSVSNTNGLAAELLSDVDSFLSDIDSLSVGFDSIKNKFNSDIKQKELYSTLKLERELDSSKNELNALYNEVELYKSQVLTKSELDKKLSNSKIKLNVIKKKIPESISILKESKIDKQVTESDIREVALTLYPSDSDSSVLNKLIKNSLDLSKKYTYSSNLEFYSISIGYMDGSTKSLSLISETVTSNIDKNLNASILEFIPKDVAQTSSEIDIKNTIYEILKDDPIISFPLETNKISYVINKDIDIEYIKKIKTVILFNKEEENQVNSPSGFFTFLDSSSSGGYLGIILFGVVAFGLLGYFMFIRKKSQNTYLIDSMNNLIVEANIYKKKGNSKEIFEIYEKISSLYKELEPDEKEITYPAIHKIFGDMKKD